MPDYNTQAGKNHPWLIGRNINYRHWVTGAKRIPKITKQRNRAVVAKTTEKQRHRAVVAKTTPVLASLCTMGFDMKDSQSALMKCNNDFNRALQLLLKNPTDQHDQHDQRRSNRQVNLVNYRESKDTEGDDVNIEFKDSDNKFYYYDGTIIQVDGSDLYVKFHSDQEIWKCYREGETIHAYSKGQQ